MNISLTDEQVDLLRQHLKQKGIYHITLKDELLDHICCAVEAEMNKGYSFEEAYPKIFPAFDQQDLKTVQQQTILVTQRKKRLTRKIITFTTSIAAGIFFFAIVSNAKERPEIHPVLYTPSTLYNQQLQTECQNKNFDSGIDYVVPEGTPVIATASGEICFITEEAKEYGKYTLINHNGKYQTLYAHLSSIVVYKGQRVAKGEIIGYSGRTGAARVPHLHYELIRKQASYK